ncbi:MAG TPA: hypothetical protein ENK90_01915 [Epsilonproteobacteria bacterium]|nr:hypothetical protein [Campylobacterota bacterium]
MQAVYHTNVNELSLSFLEMLKKQFANAKVDIIIRHNDETDYLNSSEKNRELLEKAIQEVEQSKLISKDIEDLNL